MSNHFQQTNILLCGSPRVGKSTLINAICQQQLAKTNSSLNSLTDQVERYSYTYTNQDRTHETVIWDTPGIESWDEDHVRHCSFANLGHVAWLVSECHKKNIFCALVCTNMWSGRNRQEVVDELCRLVMIVHPNAQIEKEDNIIYFDRVALVIMVNSTKYIDKDFCICKAPSGIEELIFGIAESLDRDLMLAWFRSVAQNKSFWSKMSSKLNDLLKVSVEKLNTFYDHVNSYVNYLFEPSNFTTTDLFHDAEMIEMPNEVQHKKLIFTIKSEDEKDLSDFVQILHKFGAKDYKTDKSGADGQLLTVTVEIEDAELIHRFCELTAKDIISCIIKNE